MFYRRKISPPRSPFSTPLSGSAQEAECRIRNIFQFQKKRPPVLALVLAGALAILCGGLVSCQTARSASPTLVMDTQYEDGQGNVIELPMLAIPGDGEPDEGITAINQALTELKGEYASLLAALESGDAAYMDSLVPWDNLCLLYPTQTDRYLNLLFFRSRYATDLVTGHVLSLVYDSREGRQVTLDDALALAGQTEAGLCQALAEWYAPELSQQSQEITQNQAPDFPPADLCIQNQALEGFRMGADGQPIFYLTARTDDRDDSVSDAVSGSDNLYIWQGGEFTQYDQHSLELPPLVSPEETVPMDPPLWCQRQAASGEAVPLQPETDPSSDVSAPDPSPSGTAQRLSPDLNRNGIPEEVRLAAPQNPLYGSAEIQFFENGVLIQRETPGVYLCTLDGADYILRFSQNEYQDNFRYSYRLADLSGEFEETAQWGEVSFDLNFQTLYHKSFDPEAIAAFVDELDSLLTHSVCLSQQDGALLVEPAPAVALEWLNQFPDIFTWDDGASLEENLTVFQQAMTQAFEPPAPMGETNSLPIEEPITLIFSSGAGGWGTVLELRPDGTFTGDYLDSDMATRYVCQFHGTFRDFMQLTDSSWLLTLEELVLDTGRPVGAGWNEDGFHYISSTPYGFTGQEEETLRSGAQFLFFTPEATGHAPGTELYGAYDFWTWWPNRHTLHSASDTLNCYGLYNVEGGTGFFS